MVMLMPVLFALMFVGVQAALMYQGRTIALAAAQEGARAAAAEYSSSGVGIEVARDYVSRSTSGLKQTSVIPGWSPRIVQSASMPVERVSG